MVYGGPPGKGNNKHGRTPSADWQDVVDKPYTGKSPDLPELGGRKKWAPAVVDWWAEVRRMPHCVLWTETDWRFALETAYLKAAFWHDVGKGDVKSTLATEIRRREDQMGTTGEARRKLRIRYLKPGEQPPATDAGEPGTDVELYDEGRDAGGEPPDELAERRRRVAGG